MVTGQGEMARHGVAHDAQANEGNFGGRASVVGLGIGAGHGRKLSKK
jgi:hypothetical protein